MSHPELLTRRRLLKDSSRLAAIAAASALMPPNVRRALAQDSSKLSSLSQIKHVVLLMQENRSFDHYFGTLAGVRGFSDPAALQLATGKSVFYQPDSQNADGYLLPFHLDTHKSSAQKIPSTSHAWDVQHEAWNGGGMDKWLPAHRGADGENGPYVMGYYTRADIPFQFALAEAFTICDEYYCSIMGPTWPNRMYCTDECFFVRIGEKPPKRRMRGRLEILLFSIKGTSPGRYGDGALRNAEPHEACIVWISHPCSSSLSAKCTIQEKLS